MCCRISSSGPVTQIIGGLYILLATFLVGFFAVQASSWLGPLVISENENTKLPPVFEEPTVIVKDVKSIRCGSRLETAFKIYNAGPGPIYFGSADESELVPVELTDSSDGSTTEFVGELFPRKVLPGGSVVLSVPLPPKIVAFQIRLKYSDGIHLHELNMDSLVDVKSKTKDRCYSESAILN